MPHQVCILKPHTNQRHNLQIAWHITCSCASKNTNPTISMPQKVCCVGHINIGHILFHRYHMPHQVFLCKSHIRDTIWETVCHITLAYYSYERNINSWQNVGHKRSYANPSKTQNTSFQVFLICRTQIRERACHIKCSYVNKETVCHFKCSYVNKETVCHFKCAQNKNLANWSVQMYVLSTIDKNVFHTRCVYLSQNNIRKVVCHMHRLYEN